MKLGSEEEEEEERFIATVEECLTVLEGDKKGFRESDGCKLIRQITLLEDQEDAFLMCNASSIRENFSKFQDAFPFAGPLFDIFCNSSQFVLKTLDDLGCGFVCQNRDEARLALEAGIHPSKVQFSSSMLVASHLKFASDNRINLLAFETDVDLLKIKRTTTDEVKLLLVVRPPKEPPAADDEFEALPRIVDLLHLAHSLGMNVAGVALRDDNEHNEEEEEDNDNDCAIEIRQHQEDFYRRAISLARSAFSIGRELGYLSMDTIDLGVISPRNIGMGASIKEIIEHEFGEDSAKLLQILARASEFLVSSSFVLVTRVIGKREYRSRHDGKRCFSYVINDGVYGGFGRLLFSSRGTFLKPSPLSSTSARKQRRRSSSSSVSSSSDEQRFVTDLWGPTGDELDVIGEKHFLPEMSVGDWIVFQNMGAYASVNASCCCVATFTRSFFQAPEKWGDWLGVVN